MSKLEMLSHLLLFANLITVIVADGISPEVNHHIDISTTANILKNTEFSITCSECTVVGDFSLSGGCGAFDCVPEYQPDANFTGLPFDFDDYWTGVVIEDFNVHIDLAILLTPTGPTNEITIPLLDNSGLSLSLPVGDLFSLTWTFNPVIHGWVNSSSPVNFTYGFEFEIPKSAIWIPILHLDNITTSGFSHSKITPLNYTSADPNDDFTFELSLRPIFSVTGALNSDDDISISATAFADVPKLDIAVAQVEHVTRDCAPAANSTAPDLVFANLTHVVPTLSYDVGFNATGIDQHIFELGDQTNLPTSCLDYLPSASALGPVPNLSSEAGGRGGMVRGCAWLAVVAVVAGLL